jgi:hypothetical protein
MTPAPTTTNPADGTAAHRDGNTILRYERRLEHPVTEVWAALTEPARLREWLADADVELTEGGAVQLRWLNTDDDGNHAVMDATITVLDPPRVLEIAGDPHGTLRFELADVVLPGWHIHLEHLADALAGRPVDWPRWDRDHRPRWEQLRDEYAARAAS